MFVNASPLTATWQLITLKNWIARKYHDWKQTL